jgi:hypothetical protein
MFSNLETVTMMQACALCQCRASHKHTTDRGKSTDETCLVIALCMVLSTMWRESRTVAAACVHVCMQHATQRCTVHWTDHLSGPCMCLSRHRLPTQPRHVPACLHSSNLSCPKSQLELQYFQQTHLLFHAAHARCLCKQAYLNGTATHKPPCKLCMV